VAQLGPGRKTCPTNKQQNPLDSDRPSHGRRYHNFALFLRQRRSAQPSVPGRNISVCSSGFGALGLFLELARLNMTKPLMSYGKG
jgi:hypothetical protein